MRSFNLIVATVVLAGPFNPVFGCGGGSDAETVPLVSRYVQCLIGRIVHANRRI